MKPLILISNDDGVAAKGLGRLIDVAMEFGDVVVMSTEHNASGQSHSISTSRPLRVHEVRQAERLSVYCCDGTPADSIKLATEHFCPRQPDLILGGINHGSNSSINVLYSGTMGAVIEGSVLGFNAIGFSLLSHNPAADFEPGLPYVHHIIGEVLTHGLPQGVSLNVNIPRTDVGGIKGIRICHAARSRWDDSFEKRIDPQGRPYWWLTGKFVCENPPESSDEWALAHNYISVVPIHCDFTHYPSLNELQHLSL